MGELDEISRVIGTLEGQVRNQTDALRDVRKDLGREIGDMRSKFEEHVRTVNDVVRRIQALEAWLDRIEMDAARALAERDRKMTVRLALLALGFTALNVVIALLGLVR